MSDSLFNKLDIKSESLPDWLSKFESGDTLKVIKVTDEHADNFLVSLHSPETNETFVCGMSPKNTP